MAKLTLAQVQGVARNAIEQHRSMLSLYQTLADHFYPERADFTTTRNVGMEFSDLLADSYPVLVRRDLGDSLSSMLRDGDWFNVWINGEPNQSGAMWLQWATDRLAQLFGDRASQFSRATKEGDHDFVTFGSCAISCELNRRRDGLLFRAWHLRDMSWWDDETGQTSGVVRKWKPTFREMVSYFGSDRLHSNVTDEVMRTPFKRGEIHHVVMPSEMYGDEKIAERFPYVSLFIDMVNDHIIEETGIKNRFYVIPRFKTIPGSQFAYSPATVAGLPDARSLQAMTHTLMEAAERYARPPLIATQKVVRSDVDLSPDGITWVDDEYDERLGAALQTLRQDRGGFPIGADMRENIVEVLRSAFYVSKLNLPETNRDMTAYEVSERMKQYRRENLPLFAPIEAEYNGQLCELAFEVAMEGGLLGSPYDIPESLQNRDVVFKFRSPLSVSEEEKMVQQFSQVVELTAAASQLDPNAGMNINVDQALRDAMTGGGAPESWKRPVEEVQAGRAAQMAAQAAAVAQEAQALPAPAGETGNV